MKFFLPLTTLIAVYISHSQQPIEYEISFDNAVHHEAKITVRFKELQMKPIEVRMSRSSPGRYALHEFAKNVYTVRAVDGKGKPLPIVRPNPHEWDIAHHDGTVTLTYTLFADHASGTYSGIDNIHAHLNMPATFIWARGLDERPIVITFKIPGGSDWHIATQLGRTNKPSTFTAPNLQYFMDSPTELSKFTLREWKVQSDSQTCTIRLAVHHNGSEEEVNTYQDMAKAMIYEEQAIFGELPKFDFNEYTFIADYLPYVHGDGMEHRNSTIIMSTNPLKTHATGNLGTLAHEFFHAWNVERLRPQSLEPFNFEEANMSGELWFAEGFTSYYDNLVLCRAQVISLDRFAKNLSGILNAVINSPGRNFFSAVEMSEQAPFTDGATFIDEQNKVNTFISYYPYGAAIALGLDLTLRNRFPDLALDDLMRLAWQAHGKTEKPYTNEDLRKLLGALTKSQAFADSFFQRYVYGHEIADYPKLLTSAGLLLRKAKENKASLGNVSVKYDEGKTIINAPTIMGTSLYRAGLDHGDRIIKIDGIPVYSEKDIDSVLNSHKPDQSVPIEFEQRGETRTSTITFDENQQLEVVPYESASLPATEEMMRFRDHWLSSHAREKLPELTKSCPVCRRKFPFKFEFCQFDGDSLRIAMEK